MTDAPKTIDDLFKAVIEMWTDLKRSLALIEGRLDRIEATLPNLATATDFHCLEAGQKALSSEIHDLKVAIALQTPHKAA